MFQKIKLAAKRPTVLITVALVLIGALYFLLEHHLTLWRFDKSFASVRHPPQTASIKRIKAHGNLSGRGKGTDYFIGDMRSYSGDKRRIEEFYAPIAIPSPVGDKTPLGLCFIENGKLEHSDYYMHELQTERYNFSWIKTHSDLPDDFSGVEEWLDNPTQKHGKLYIVFVQDQTEPSY